MKKIFNVLILAIMIVVCGCSNPTSLTVGHSSNEESKNSISYIAKDKYARAAVNNVNPLLHIDIYKVPVLPSGKFDYDNKEFVRTEILKYGEEKEIERCTEKGYIYMQ